ncbi:histidine kinase [Ferruginibacter sp. SUN002]|uniref:tetratricopeptide repeat-containing sensor histidine kinase n=1 Tax=Ferruginibacter sp. SUN002 TaxID=2937789 RepID=UPI003D3647DC
MKQQTHFKLLIVLLLLLYSGVTGNVSAQMNQTEKISQAGKKIEKGYAKNNQDTVAKGHYELGESFYRRGELEKSEEQYKKAKAIYEKTNNAVGIAKASRSLAKVQEDLHKNKEALANYKFAQENNIKAGDVSSKALNSNDFLRLSNPDSTKLQQKLIEANIDLGLKNKDTSEVLTSYSRMADINWNGTGAGYNTVGALNNAYNLSVNDPPQALKINQQLTSAYLKDKNFDKAIETKKEILKEPFVANSTQLQASETTLLADIYLQKNDDSTAIRLLNESYALSIKNGHTLEAKRNIEKLDSIYRSSGQKEMSLQLYKSFLSQLPDIIAKDSSLIDNKIIEETVGKIQKLESEKALKDALIKRKNIFNYWLIGSLVVLLIISGVTLSILKKLKVRNKKIALQSLRREMNPHFIFNSLNSINQFIANNNELEANQYLTKFSTLMRRVMENSKEDFVLLSNELELLQNYLELEKSRFPDKFNFKINVDDELYANEQLYIPGMLIQPHLENSIWHGLRYIEGQGLLQLSFSKNQNAIDIVIEDNGIGIAGSKNVKTANQKKHSGRGITNTMERIKILNELYHQKITCSVEDKPQTNPGVLVKITVPLLKNIENEN